MPPRKKDKKRTRAGTRVERGRPAGVAHKSPKASKTAKRISRKAGIRRRVVVHTEN